MTTNSEFLPTTEYALLGFLNEGPSHGYELHKKITDPEGIGMIWGVKIANMYAQLEKLARKGLIHGGVLEHEQRPARTEYSLTPAGKEEFQRWLTRLIEHPRDFRHDFMARVYFLLRLQPEKLPGVIDQQLAATQRWLSNTIEKEKGLSRPATFENLTYHFRVSQIQSMLDWLTWLKAQHQISKFQRGEQ
jgi:DNA-binding PadR family transcriptional regulator